MSRLPSIISFYRSCYQADNRSINLTNFFSRKVQGQKILTTADLITGKFDRIPLESEWAEEQDKKLLVYGKEKDLYACTFFVIGYQPIAGKTQKVCAPLILHPIHIVKEEEVFYLELAEGQNIINPAIITMLRSDQSETDPFTILNNLIPNKNIGFTEACEIQELLNDNYQDQIDAHLLPEYPELFSGEELKKLYARPSKEQLLIVPAIGVGLMNKSTASRGVVNELEEMRLGNDYSKPLQSLFEERKRKNSKKKSKEPIYVPALLSKAQKNIFTSIKKHLNTLVIGPPGTGKSFTIASIAIDAIAKGKTVLISSKSNQAVDVIADKIKRELDLPGVVVRGGKRGYKKELKQQLDAYLHGIGIVDVKRIKVSGKEKHVAMLDREISRLEAIAKAREQRELNWGEFLEQYSGGFFQKVRMYFLKKRTENLLPFWEVIEKMEEDIITRNEKVRELILLKFQFHLSRIVRYFRIDLLNFLKALRSRTGNRKEQYFDQVQFDKLLKAFPVWLVNSTDISNNLPLQKELFDLVIMDEATQCDIASSLPVLQRGKKAVIVGDPKQLRHISFLSNRRQQDLVRKHGLDGVSPNLLDYRESSILDLFSNTLVNQDQVHFLDEHYRSFPDIIQFSNEYFYNRALKIMTETPFIPKGQNVVVHTGNSKRAKGGHNEGEVEVILREVRKIMEKEKELDSNLCQSLGILSPFRDQVDFLQKKVEKEFSITELTRHRILIGTPFAFQGEERDVMFLSFAVDAETHPSTFQYLNRPDVFNVSITRARSLQKVYLSVGPDSLNKEHLLSQYLATVSNREQTNQKKRSQKYRDHFLLDVMKEMEKVPDMVIHPAYSVVGQEIDLVIIYKGKTFCIDLIGYPGQFGEALSLESYKMLSRIDIKVYPLSYSSWFLDRKNTLDKLLSFLSEQAAR